MSAGVMGFLLGTMFGSILTCVVLTIWEDVDRWGL